MYHIIADICDLSERGEARVYERWSHCWSYIDHSSYNHGFSIR